MPKLKFTIMAEMPEPEVIDAGSLLSAYRSGAIDLICVLGPTASGKTKYAVSLAKELNSLCGQPF